MKLTPRQKKTSILTAGILLLLIMLVLITNLIIGHLIESTVRNAFEKEKDKNYHITVRTVRANILTGNINFKDLEITPDSLFLGRLKRGEGKNSVAVELKIPTLRLAGIDLYRAVMDHRVILRKILFRNAGVKIITGEKPKQEKAKKELQKNFSIDSVYMKGIDGIDIGAIMFDHCRFQIYNLVKEKVVIRSNELEFNVKGFYLEELGDTSDFFRLHLENLQIELNNEKLEIPDGNYYMGFEQFRFDLAQSTVEIRNMEFKPTYSDKYELAKKLKYTAEIYDLGVEYIKIASFDLRKIINSGMVLIDSIKVRGLDLNILMDKRLPFNEKRRPKLPNQAVKYMNLPLYIGKINIEDSYLKYQEKMEASKELMTVDLDDLQIQIHFVTSIEDSINTRKPMLVHLQSKFMKRTPFTVNFEFPLTSRVDTFYYTGHLSSAKMNAFNPASYPAMGLNFKQGKLKEVNFKGSANRTYSKGQMLMLYNNLEAEIVKKNEVDKNRFMSWAANTVIYKSNPGKNNKLRTASMEFNRVMYKGFGNLIWKTLQNGIMNTVLPAGKLVKPETSPKEKNSGAIPDKKKSRKESRKNRKGGK